MIISSINDKLIDEVYKNAHPRLQRAIEALRELANKSPEDGKYTIDGDEIFASVMTYETKPECEKKFELHRRYIDIQYIIEGEEIIGGEDISELCHTDGEGTDIEFFGMVKNYDRILLKKGELAIIFPPEPHAPGIAAADPVKVKKIVVKVLM
jgi:YhcH/YjgK/YiaL family protein